MTFHAIPSAPGWTWTVEQITPTDDGEPPVEFTYHPVIGWQEDADGQVTPVFWDLSQHRARRFPDAEQEDLSSRWLVQPPTVCVPEPEDDADA